MDTKLPKKLTKEQRELIKKISDNPDLLISYGMIIITAALIIKVIEENK